MHLASILVFAVLVFGAGCAATQTQTRVASYAPNAGYAPTDPTAIQIYRSFPPNAFTRLGEIEIDSPNYAQVDFMGLTETPSSFEMKMRQAAAQIGGDGIVIVDDRPAGTTQSSTVSINSYQNPVTGSVQTSGTATGPQSYGRKVYGVVIKFS